jgi:hypothetical protein
MGAGIFGLAVLLPATLIALVAALWFAISAARAGHTLTAIASLGGLLMIASPFVLASFAQRPQADEENPIFMIEYGIFLSALLAVVMLSLRWLGSLGAATLAAYPLIWVFAFRELSGYATPRLAKPKQG